MTVLSSAALGIVGQLTQIWRELGTTGLSTELVQTPEATWPR